MTFLDAASEKTLRSTVALTAARGRGKVSQSLSQSLKFSCVASFSQADTLASASQACTIDD